ncbi:MAG: SCP2 sterol-binding domain-containing protein [Gammaproteobacteria bacterium]|tara:strand:+ start:1399 stop:1989 length:591 start_codon:yes stop_codon:yes gene_type:complete
MLKNKSSAIKYINKVLQSDAFNKSIPDNFLSEINDKKIKINLKDINYSTILHISDNTIIILDEEGNFDVELITTPATLALFILSKGSDKFSSKIIINGDIDTANKFNNFLSSSEKIKEILIHLIGKEKTKDIEKGIKSITAFFNDIFSSSASDLVDFLTDDLTVLPSKSDVNQFLDEVDSLKSRTDKLYQKYKDVK